MNDAGLALAHNDINSARDGLLAASVSFSVLSAGARPRQELH